jgi:hypothetical protein
MRSSTSPASTAAISCEHGVVVGAFALEEDVPHAAGRADEDQAIGFEVIGQRQAEEGHAA